MLFTAILIRNRPMMLAILSVFIHIVLIYPVVSTFSRDRLREEYVQRMYTQPRKLINADRFPILKIPEIKRINDKFAMIVLSTMRDTGKFIRERIIPSARTWMSLLYHVYVILEDTAIARLSLRYCDDKDFGNFTTFECRDEATYILTRQCTAEYYFARGICCKVDSALQFVTFYGAELFRNIEYVVIGDDDEYWRVDQLLKWLYLVHHANISHIPIIGNNHRYDPEELGGVWGKKAAGKCSEVHSIGWYQPLLLNKRALNVVSKSVMDFGITAVCNAYEISQDVGVGVWAWQHQLFHIFIPKGETPGHAEFQFFSPDAMFVHAVRNYKVDKCEGEKGKEWEAFRHNQSIMVGCGTVNTAVPTHNRMVHMNMYDAWNYFAENGADIPFVLIAENQWTRVDRVWTPVLHQLKGYEATDHYIKYENSSIWNAYTPSDCAP